MAKSKKKNVYKKKSNTLLKQIKKPAFLRFLGYIADTQGCGTIRCIYPYLLLNHIIRKNLKVNATYMANFIPDPNFYKDFTLIQFQRSATEQHYQMFNHFKQKISPVAKVPIIYEIDDLLIDIPKWNYAHEYYKNNEEYVKKIIGLADGVVTSTVPLANVYSEFNKNIIVILNHLPKFIWGDIYPAHEYYQGGKIKILWAGSANHFSIKHLAEKGIHGGDFGNELMNFIRKTTDKYDWIFMGAMPMELENIKSKIKFVPWVDVFNYPRVMKSLEADIGIAPLVPGIFNESKCITANSLVNIDSGIKFIDDIKIGDKINEKEILNTIQYKNQKTIKLKTKFGYEIEGTFSHRIKDDKCEWKRLENFRIGDKVSIASYEINNKEIQSFTLDNKNDIISINEDWGSILGYIYSSGYINNNSISIISNNGSFIIPLTSLLEKNNIEYKNVSSNVKNIIEIKYNGLFSVLHNYYYLNNGFIDKMLVRIPNFIFNSPKNIIKNFIKSVFEVSGDIKDNLYFITKSNYFAREIQYLLLGFKVLSEIVVNGIDNKVIIKSPKNFNNNINFHSDVKKRKLYVYVNNNENTFEFEHNWIGEIVEKEEKVNDVYDIEIEGHLYNSNGFISHNSNIKQLEFVASGMPGVYSDVYPYKDTTLKCKSDEEIIANIEKLASNIDLRAKVFESDYQSIKNQLYWEENNNLMKYVDSYLSLFGKRL